MPDQKSKRTFIRLLKDTVDNSFKEAIPYTIFLAIAALLYISNTYYAEKTIRDIYKTDKELKELRFEYLTTKSDLMYRSKQSEVAKLVGPLGLKEARIPPTKIVLNK